jgi:hypothetical protein
MKPQVQYQKTNLLNFFLINLLKIDWNVLAKELLSSIMN